jgi:hypothetical protein
MSEEARKRVVASLPGEVTDAEMSPPEGDRHFQAKVRALETLRSYFVRQRRRVYLAAELPVYYPGARRFAPDLLAVLDVDPHERDKWVVSAEGKGLDFVLEVHVGGDRKKDAEENVTRYARLGIPEYFNAKAALVDGRCLLVGSFNLDTPIAVSAAAALRKRIPSSPSRWTASLKRSLPTSTVSKLARRNTSVWVGSEALSRRRCSGSGKPSRPHREQGGGRGGRQSG